MTPVTSDDPGSTSKKSSLNDDTVPTKFQVHITLYTNMTSDDPRMTSDDPGSNSKKILSE